MEIMEIEHAALVALILIGFIQLPTFEVLLEHQRRWHNVDFMMLCYPRTARMPSPPFLH